MISCLIDNTSTANTSFSFMKVEGTTAAFAIEQDKSKNGMNIKASSPVQ